MDDHTFLILIPDLRSRKSMTESLFPLLSCHPSTIISVRPEPLACCRLSPPRRLPLPDALVSFVALGSFRDRPGRFIEPPPLVGAVCRAGESISRSPSLSTFNPRPPTRFEIPPREGPDLRDPRPSRCAEAPLGADAETALSMVLTECSFISEYGKKSKLKINLF